MSRSHAATLDDESDGGQGRVIKCSRREDNNLTFVVGEGVGEEKNFPPFPALSHCRPHAPTSLCFQNGGLVLET